MITRGLHSQRTRARISILLAVAAWTATAPPYPGAIAHANITNVSPTLPPAWRDSDREAGDSSFRRWVSLGPANLPGSIYCVAFEPDRRGGVLVGVSGGGIWMSRTNGKTWKPIGDRLPSLVVSAICVIPGDPKTIVVGTGDAVFGNDWIHGVGIIRSTDGGTTWSQTSVVIDSYSRRNGYHAIEANPVSGVLLAAGVSGLLRSTDDGATWAEIESTGNWTDVKWRPGSADSAYAVKEFGGLYASSDGGRSFRHLGGALPADSSVAGQSRIAVTPSDPACVYVGFGWTGPQVSPGIYRSRDGGATWAQRAGGNGVHFAGPWNGVLIVNPSDSNDVMAGGFGLYRSRDGGSTWTEARFPFPIEPNAIAYRPGSGSEVWLVTQWGAFQSLDGGDTWLERDHGLVTLELYHVCSARDSRSFAYVGSQYQGTPRYEGRMDWLRSGDDGSGPGRDGMICNCNPSDPRHVYGENQYGLHFVSRDGVATSRLIMDGLTGDGRFVTPVDMDPSNPAILFTATNAGIFRTRNGGELWERVGEGQDIVSISVSPVAGNWVWALERSSGLVRRSSDGGATWISFQAAPFALIAGTSIVADPADSQAALCAFRRHPLHPPVVLRTRDGGRSWQDVSGNLQGQSVNTIAIDPSKPDEWYAGAQVGVWRTQDGGASWSQYGKGLPNAVVMDLEIVDAPRLLRAATYGRGLWEVRLEPITHDGRGARAQGLLLDAVRGNPGHGVVLFRYKGSGTARLQLRVYDVSGRRIAEVAAAPADGIVRTGTWETGGVAAGVYFAVLEAADARLVRKVVVSR